MDDDRDAPTARAQDPLFVHACSLKGLAAKLPLAWPTPPGTPPSPKQRYRSFYTYTRGQDLHDPATWEHLSDFDLCLRLIDFTGLRPVLAQRLGWTSARGWRPFDPVSLFLLAGWQITNNWNRTQTLANLGAPLYADYAQRFGFKKGTFPTEGGLRYFATTLGARSQTPGRTVSVPLDDAHTVAVPVEHLNQLLAGSVTLIHDAGLISNDAWQKGLVCPDGMLHDAASRMHCAFVQNSCYAPRNPQTHTRPCPAKAADPPRKGCACDTIACAQICRHATPRDAQARMVVYTGSNQSPDSPNHPATPSPDRPSAGKLRYGYRSGPLQLADAARRTSLVLLDTLEAASAREENPAAALLRQVSTFYPTLHLDTTAGDAGLGYEAYLGTAYDLGVKRVVDLRADPTDKNKDGWVTRAYDDKGRPICPHGYALTAYGFDAQRHCHKWICAQACLRKVEPSVTLTTATDPPVACPYRDAHHPPCGQVVNIGKRFADGSMRLVRDLPVGTPAWERTYHRARNASESRHAALERWGLKRLPVYGAYRAKAVLFQADVWLNLTTMARLVHEATLADGGP
jgi:hypothetical protein